VSTPLRETPIAPGPPAPGRLPAPGRRRGERLRHQLPVYSPLSARAVAATLPAALRLQRDPRPALASALRDEFGADDVVLCGSGTQALQLALRLAMQQTAVDHVALPAFSCYDVAAAAAATAGRLSFYDIDPETLGPDLDSLERALRAGATIVVVAPLYGMPVDWHAVERCCVRHGAFAIEDAAQAAGGRWRGRPIGGFGRLSVLSFGRGKGWTGGRGGALLSRGVSLQSAQPLEPPGTAGIRADTVAWGSAFVQAVLARPAVYRLPASIPWLHLGETVYRAAAAPAPLARSAAALVAATCAGAAEEAERRRATAAAWRAELRPGPGRSWIREVEHADPGYLRFPIRLARGMDGFADPRQALRLGVAPSYPQPLPVLPAVQPLRVRTGESFPGAAQLARELVTLPTHSRLEGADLVRVLHLLDRYGV
jgi:perosamine synthetase